MKYRLLGSSGLLVSRVSLGTMTFGAPEWGCDEREAHAILKAFLDGGGNSIDAANVYAGGKSEEIIGNFLPQVGREQVVLASKCYFPLVNQPNRFGSSRKHVLAACEESLRRLRTDYLDIYYIHGPDPVTPVEETLRAYDDLVRQGKVRYLGCSNLFGWQIAKAAGIAGRLQLEPLVAGQYIYSLIHRELEREVIPAALDSGIGITCYGVLGGGLMTGKYRGQPEPPKGSRLQIRSQMDGARFWHPKGLRVAELLESLAKETGASMARLAMGWPLRRKFVSSVVVGVRTSQQVKENLDAAEWDMPDDVWQSLEAATRPDDDNLTWFNRANYQRFLDAAEFHPVQAELL
jgi:1-deoxyxylulose-5-phosphate synthase